MDENEFLLTLNKKAAEQKRVAETEILPGWAKGLGEWLVVNPWRVLVPIAIIVYMVFRIWYGTKFRELTLAIFGGF